MIFDGSNLEDPLIHAAAYFARCRRLLIGMDSLLEQGMVDLAPVFFRPLFECWLRGRWLLQNGKMAFDRLVAVADAKDKQWAERQAAVDWVNKMEWIPDNDLGALKLVKEMAEVVGGGALSAGPALVETYYMAYVSESERNIHHGLAGVVGHIARSTSGSLHILPNRLEVGDGHNHVAWCAMLLLNFARYLFPHFGLSVEPLDSFPTLLSDVLVNEWQESSSQQERGAT
jgi:hypothetical protein